MAKDRKNLRFNVDEFCRDLAAIAAKQLIRVSAEDRENALAELQDATSLFKPYTADHIDKIIGLEGSPYRWMHEIEETISGKRARAAR